MEKLKDLVVRQIKQNEISLLEDLLYEAVFQSNPAQPIPREVIDVPEVRAYIKDYGSYKDDYCLVAELNKHIIGAVWIRIICGKIKGYGNIDSKTPEFAISLFPPYRNLGIGTLLMKEMISYLKSQNYKQCSLSVDKMNYAVKLYKSLGFKTIRENEEDYIMLLELQE